MQKDFKVHSEVSELKNKEQMLVFCPQVKMVIYNDAELLPNLLYFITKLRYA